MSSRNGVGQERGLPNREADIAPRRLQFSLTLSKRYQVAITLVACDEGAEHVTATTPPIAALGDIE